MHSVYFNRNPHAAGANLAQPPKLQRLKAIKESPGLTFSFSFIWYSKHLIPAWICEKTIDGRHNFWRLVADKFPQEMLLVLFSLVEILQYSSSPVLLAHSDLERAER